jgi:hypothetical protein
MRRITHTVGNAPLPEAYPAFESFVAALLPNSGL